MPLFEIVGDAVNQIHSGRFALERQLQRLVEANTERLLGVRFIASEVSTGDRQRGRIDSLGLDVDGSPTIIEYKRSKKDNVINQGLFYLDWLVDHKGDFIVAAQERFGPKIEVSWENPRLILIAESFSEYDEYAVNRIGANIELWIYRLYGENLLYLEQIFAPFPKNKRVDTRPDSTNEFEQDAIEQVEEIPVYTVEDHLGKAKAEIQELFFSLRERILELADGDSDIVEIPNKLYITYRHGKNFAEVVFQAKALRIFLDIPIEQLRDNTGLTRDVSNVGHWGTGDVEVRIAKAEDIEQVFPFIEQAFRLTL